jgi:FAD/FMN-containing dehydrogenase/Fe-S oxidoreductase
MSAPDTSIVTLKQLMESRAANWRTSGTSVDVAGLEAELREKINGEVRFDASTKAMYAADASNYRQVPLGVVIPRSKEDVVQAVAAARKFGAPLLSRGTGTSLAGQCCNIAVVIDWSKYLHGVLEINTSERWARVLPGTVCDELRDAAMKASGGLLTWGPDPATHAYCTFGGMIGNNACGAHAQMSGKTDNNVEELDILLYDGTRMTVGWMAEADFASKIRQAGREGEVYRYLHSLRDHYADLVIKNYPVLPRRVSGYNLDQLIPGKDGRINIARALVGSEGTLVTILEAKCTLIDARAERVLLLLGYPDMYVAADHVMDITPFHPTALEGIDDHVYRNVEKKGGPNCQYLRLFPEGNGWLIAEFGAEKKSDAIDTAHLVMERLKRQPGAPNMRLYSETLDMQHVWSVRESGLGASSFVPGERPAWPGWEDSAVPPEKLGGYLRDMRDMFAKYDYQAAMYGHFGHGCVHCRIDFDLASEQGIRTFNLFMEEATDLCVKYGGSLSGEHGDGQSHSEFLYKMFGEELVQAFREFKSIWDPAWKMNPGKVVDAYRMDENLRLGANYNPWEPPTHFQWPQDDGHFSHAALRCVGVGKCRREHGQSAEDNTMCPSFMVTHEEKHTTRGRARHLWEMLNGNVIEDGWRDENVKESLDLCLACKGCKGDCPVSVDMATYKAEFLSHYWEGQLRPRYAYVFGFIDIWAGLAAIAPGFVNLITQLPGLRTIAKKAAGISPDREIPQFAPMTFKQWFRRRGPRHQPGPKVILWADTFNNHFLPETAQAALEVLEHFGYRVHVPTQHLCCGRPLYDYGFLDDARRYLGKILATLADEIDAGTPIVVLEPSCCSVFRDELIGLMPENERAHRLAENTYLFSEFLEKKAKHYEPPQLPRKALTQGHCHHKAIMRFYDEEAVMKKMGLDFTTLASGCCGMAGSFGFEAEKYDLSIRIGERGLLPAVRKADMSTVVIADGFSCREQIAQGSDRHALHLAEVMALALRGENPDGDGSYPENQFVQPRIVEQRRSVRRAGLVTLMTVAVVAGAWWWSRKR